MDENEIDWNRLPLTQAHRKWADLTTPRKVQVWKNASEEERKILRNVASDSELEFFRQKLGNNDGNAANPEESKEVEELEQDLTRIHRDLMYLHQEDIKSHLGDVNDKLHDYVQNSQTRSQRRRAENIYVLVAIGIVTGFFTVYRNLRIDSGPVDVLAAGIALTAAIFLFIKLHTVAISRPEQDNIGGKTDRFADFLFRVSITGAFLLGVSGIFINIANIDVTSIATNSAEIFVIVNALIATAAGFLLTRYQGKRLLEARGALEQTTFNSVQNEMFELAESGVTDSDVQEFLTSVEDFSKHSSLDDLRRLRERVSKISIQGGYANEVMDSLDELIEQKEMASKTEEELRQMKMDELQNDQERLRGRIK